jgi:hypothetical protein
MITTHATSQKWGEKKKGLIEHNITGPQSIEINVSSKSELTITKSIPSDAQYVTLQMRIR